MTSVDAPPRRLPTWAVAEGPFGIRLLDVGIVALVITAIEVNVIVGDVKAGSITVAAGSRMRGHVEFGWEEEKGKIRPGLVSNGS